MVKIVSASGVRARRGCARETGTLRLDAVIVMPNHLHGIVALVEATTSRRGAQLCAPAIC